MEEELDIKEPLMLTPLKKNKRGQLIHSSQKLQIINLHKKLKKENPKILNKDAVAQLAKETGIGACSIKNILLQYKRTGAISTPNKQKRRLTFKEKIDEFDKSTIRRKVHEFYFNDELPTLNKVLQAVNADENLPNFKRSTFHLLLKELNFTYTCRHHHRILTEREDLIVWRRNYLRTIKRYREEGRQIYYLDETWVNVDDDTHTIWIEETVKPKKGAFLRGLSEEPTNPSGKGKRLLIVLHIGSAAGFVPGGLLCFESKHTGVYHDEMNDTFLEWFKSILPLLDNNAVIVMDNALYHSVKVEKLPNTSWKKAEIMKWLEGKGKEISETMVKAELLQVVALQKNKFDKYVIDEMAKQDNKTVLRLPPYHCELNPIEMVWSMVKEYVKSNTDSFEIQDVKLLVEQGVNRVTSEHWSNFIRHVRNEEKKMWEIDDIADKMIDSISPLLIITNETDSEISDSDY
ncbi:uncharacterized protein [Linepithema humile]|uniref:uncharacterized protein n=1 Tax=Linepithema humile TaxID=83485 RepID=UPI0006237C3F|nr:PREDICTED: uncharacterized protein LOC105668906 [Linepithema humile]